MLKKGFKCKIVDNILCHLPKAETQIYSRSMERIFKLSLSLYYFSLANYGGNNRQTRIISVH